MGDINDMITNIASGDLAKAQGDFEDVLSAKIMDRLEQQRAYVAQETFNGDDTDDEVEDALDELDTDNDDYEGEYDDESEYDESEYNENDHEDVE